jgi:hypothetical protein
MAVKLEETGIGLLVLEYRQSEQRHDSRQKEGKQVKEGCVGDLTHHDHPCTPSPHPYPSQDTTRSLCSFDP